MYRRCYRSSFNKRGGQLSNGILPSNYTKIAQDMKISPNTAKKIGQNFATPRTFGVRNVEGIIVLS